MTNHPLFKAYLAVVCFMPAFVLAGLIGWLVTGPVMPRDPMTILPFVLGFVGFQLVGMLVLFIDLWRSDLPGYDKATWGRHLFTAMAIAAPIYWFKKIRKRGNVGSQDAVVETVTFPISEEVRQAGEGQLAQRVKYHSSGQVGPEFFVLAAPLLVAAALAMGAALFGMWRIGFYFYLIVPLLVSLPVAGAMVLAVRLGRCRNRPIVVVFGILAGLLLFGSSYHFDMVDVQGADHALRLDALPAHIWLRLQTDRVEAHPGIGHANDPPTPWANYIFFILDAVVIGAVIGGVAYERAGRVYCDESDRWAAYHTRSLPPGTGQAIVNALMAGRLDDCLPGLQVLPDRKQQPHCQMILEVCSDPWDSTRESEGCCAYLSLREMLFQTKVKRSGSSFGFETVIWQIALTSEEFRKFQEEFLDSEANAKRGFLRAHWPRLAALTFLTVVAGVLLWKKDDLLEVAQFGPAEQLQAGQMVFWKADAKAWDGAREVPIAEIAFPAVVEEVQDDRVWLGRAWVKSREVMLADRALPYYTQLALSGDDSAAWVCRGVIFIEKGDYNNAISDFRNAIRANPNYGIAYFRRGMAFEALGNLELARQDYDQAIRLNPRDKAALRFRALLLRTGEFENAAADFDASLQIDPTDVITLRARGAVRLQQGQFDSALADLNEAIRVNPKDAEAYTSRGLVWEYKAAYDKAVDDYTQVLKLLPNDSAAYCNRGRARDMNGDFESAMKDFNTAVALNPRNTAAMSQCGHAWYSRREYGKAIEQYSHALRVNPKDAEVCFSRATAWMASGQTDNAIRDCDESIRLNPNYSAPYCTRGAARRLKGELLESMDDYSEAIRLDPQHPTAYCNRGAGWREAGEYAKARQDYTEAIRVNENYVNAHLDLAWMYATAVDSDFRNGQKAVEEATKACELTGWKTESCFNVLAAAYAESGDFESAVKWQQKAIEMTTDEAYAATLRARIELYQQKQPHRERPVKQ